MRLCWPQCMKPRPRKQTGPIKCFEASIVCVRLQLISPQRMRLMTDMPAHSHVHEKQITLLSVLCSYSSGSFWGPMPLTPTEMSTSRNPTNSVRELFLTNCSSRWAEAFRQTSVLWTWEWSPVIPLTAPTLNDANGGIPGRTSVCLNLCPSCDDDI